MLAKASTLFYRAVLRLTGAWRARLREQLADLAHDQWSGWMSYLFNKSQQNADGTVTIPAWAVERWQRQMRTPYADLSPAEQQSDRAEADRVLDVVFGAGD